ncbi:cell wall assembly regulator SMI1 [Agrobacterium tumefaciens]|uniref:SMI1/KNR4 family protein n=1 Tax=Agrobacterium tumefaciens TaxID=358 RepID=UPI001AE1470F|nr:cell wall assembly regulator SMI1 [Agrobacterium tumefaciens]
MKANEFKDHLLAILATLSGQGYKADQLVFEPPASEIEVQTVEKALGFQIPQSFRIILTTVSRHVEFHWSAPDGLEYPPPFRSSFSGELKWSLDALLDLEAERQNWIEVVFLNMEDDYDCVWHDKFAFQEVPNGDFIAIDLQPENAGKVVYLSHDDGEGHGATLAASFSELLKRWVPLACAGAEDWQWIPFLEQEVGLNPDGENAHTWRTLLHLS